MAKIIFKRTSQFANYFRSYAIVVNNETITNIYNGEEYELELDAGSYQIKAKIDWLGSEIITINLAENEVKRFEIGCVVMQNKLSLVLTLLTFAILIGSILFYEKITIAAWCIILFLFILREFILKKGKSNFYHIFIKRSKYLYIKELS